jgi:hypothetical protein
VAFNTDALTKIVSKALIANVIDGSNESQWYESRSAFGLNLDGKAIWTEMALLSTLIAPDYATAVQNAIDNPTVLK